MDTAIAFALGLIAAGGILVPAVLRWRRSSLESGAAAEAAARQLADLRESTARSEDELRFLTHFLADYPRLAHSLHSGLSERQVSR